MIFNKFGIGIAEVIFKAEFVCDRRPKYFADDLTVSLKFATDWHDRLKLLYGLRQKDCTSRGADSGPHAPPLGFNPMHILFYPSG